MKQLLILIFLFTSSLLFAQADGFTKITDVSDFKEKAKKVSQETNTIISDFVQEKNLSIMDEKIITKGKFLFQKENSIRWEYTDPFVYLIVIKEGEIFIKDEGNESKFDMKSNKMFSNINDMIVNSVQGKILEDDNFSITYYKNATQYMVQLIPKDEKMKEMLSKIQIYFDTKDYAVAKVKMMEESEDYTSISFINRVVNTPIEAHKFSFK